MDKPNSVYTIYQLLTRYLIWKMRQVNSRV